MPKIHRRKTSTAPMVPAAKRKVTFSSSSSDEDNTNVDMNVQKTKNKKRRKDTQMDLPIGSPESAALIMVPADQLNDLGHWTEELRRAQREDPECSAFLNNPGDYHRVRYDLLRRVSEGEEDNDRIVIPHSVAWRLVLDVHRYLTHFGTDKVMDFIEEYFDMQHAHAIVRDVVASCEICQATKPYTRATVGEQYYNYPTEVGELLSLDLYGPLPRSQNGYTYVLVIMDVLNKHTALYPMKNQKAETVIRCLEEDYLPQRGFVPQTILTDCGGQFLTNAWRDFGRNNNISLRKTAPYNPQANPVERVMRELGRVLRCYAHADHTMWDIVLPRFEAILNMTSHSSTGCPPIWLEPNMKWIDSRYVRLNEYPRTLYQRRLTSVEKTLPTIGFTETPMELKLLRSVCDPARGVDNEPRHRIERVESTIVILRESARKRNVQAAKKQVAKPYQPGDWVLKKTSRRSDAAHKKTRKLIPFYEGPFVIERSTFPNTYILREPGERATHQANTRMLRPYRNPRLRGLNIQQMDELPPEDDEINDNTRDSSESDSFREQLDSSNGGSLRLNEEVPVTLVFRWFLWFHRLLWFLWRECLRTTEPNKEKGRRGRRVRNRHH